jgi:hypothetical protein
MINKFVKKLKAYEREALLPLYYQHAEYLLRVIKTVKIAEWILAKIDTYIEVATCHEVAINSLSSLQLETHQNRLGKEREYTNHAQAKNVGRDLRVRLVWAIIKSELEKDLTLANYAIYENLSDIPDGRVFCPICGHVIREYQYERIIDSIHEDGTENYHYSISYDIEDPCEHLIVTDYPSDFFYYDDELQFLFRNLRDMGEYFGDIQTWLFQNQYSQLLDETEDHADSQGNEILNYFVKDVEIFRRALRWYYAEKCLESDIEYEEY